MLGRTRRHGNAITFDGLTADGLHGWGPLDPADLPSLRLEIDGVLTAVDWRRTRRDDLPGSRGKPAPLGFAVDEQSLRTRRVLRERLEAMPGDGRAEMRVVPDTQDAQDPLAASGIEPVSVSALVEYLGYVRDGADALVDPEDALSLIAPAAGDGRPSVSHGADGLTTVAFYLPQFHPFDINDANWGPGFTEWTNVVSAKSAYEEHPQPTLPADLGFYDARLPELRESQASLARKHGIDAFCYYYYWFSGRRVMTEVVDSVLATGRPDFPYCLCWANETWSRRWDGSEAEILLEQRHDPDVDVRIVDDLMAHFTQPNYLKVDGKPILLIYRVDIIPDPLALLRAIRARAKAAGLPGLYVCAVGSFGLASGTDHGFDALVRFPPHHAEARQMDPAELPGLSSGFEGKIYDYASYAENAVARPMEASFVHEGVMPRWDNTARKGSRAHVFANSSPDLFATVAKDSISRTTSQRDAPPLMFINSWNEWAEGAHLEPDARYGRGYLQAYRDARAEALGAASEEKTAERLMAENVSLTRLIARMRPSPMALRTGVPSAIKASTRIEDDKALGSIDEIGGRRAEQRMTTIDMPTRFHGWAAPKPPFAEADQVETLIELTARPSGDVQYLRIDRRVARSDVGRNVPGLSDSVDYGFEGVIVPRIVGAGIYVARIVLVVSHDDEIVALRSEQKARLVIDA